MTICPHCKSITQQVKAGKHGGSQRYKCMICRRRYTPQRRTHAETASVLRQKSVPAAGQPRPDAVEAGLAFGKRKPTISEVAARAGVSVATVSNFINDKGRMSETTRLRIRQAMTDLHFTPSALMRAIHRRRTRILGVMMFDLSTLDQNTGTAIAPQLLAGINAAAFEATHNILLYTGLPYQSLNPLGNDFLDGHIDGLIWVSRERNEPTLERVAAAGLPTVALLTRQVPPGIGYVQADNIAGTRALVGHLAAQGHRRIAYLGTTHSGSVADRREGYRLGLGDVGLPYLSELITPPSDNRLTEATITDMVAAWLALPLPPTAIMVQYDRFVAPVLSALRAQGRRVPEDVAVTGFDDAPEAQWLGGGLTTVRQPFARMGRLAVQSLIGMIEGTSVDDCRHIVPTELVVRTTG